MSVDGLEENDPGGRLPSTGRLRRVLNHFVHHEVGRYLGALAITEPGEGSDAAALATHAKRVDGGYVLDGSKTWISNAPCADVYVVFAHEALAGVTAGVKLTHYCRFEMNPL
jgi:hypothetical protein